MVKQNFKTRLKNFLSGGLVKGALFLCLSVFICKLIGVIYRIPLVNVLGISGIGVYQLIFPLYSFLLILSSNALPVALSKIVAEKISQADYVYIKALKRVSFLIFGTISLVLTMALVVLSYYISLAQGNAQATLGYVFIAPSIFFVCLISVYRGIFQGYKNMAPTGVSQIIEQAVKFVLGLLLPYLFAFYGTAFQVAMATLGVTISEFVAFLYLLIKSRLDKNFKTLLKTPLSTIYYKQNKRRIACDLFSYSTPIMLSNCVLPICVLIESFLIVNILSLKMPQSFATEIYGIYSGIVCVLINAPIMLCNSVGVALVPNLNKVKQYKVKSAKSLKEKIRNFAIKSSKHINKKTSVDNPLKQCFLLVSAIAIPSFVAFVLASNVITGILFPSLSVNFLNLTNTLLVFSSFNVVSLSFANLLVYYLQANHIMYRPVICLAIFNFLRLIACSVVLYFYGIIAYCIVGAGVYIVQLMQLNNIKKRFIC